MLKTIISGVFALFILAAPGLSAAQTAGVPSKDDEGIPPAAVVLGGAAVAGAAVAIALSGGGGSTSTTSTTSTGTSAQ